MRNWRFASIRWGASVLCLTSPCSLFAQIQPTEEDVPVALEPNRPSPVSPQPVFVEFDTPDPVQMEMQRSRQFGQRQTTLECLRDAERSGDIIVCGRDTSQALPVPEVFGPVPGSSDGSAVNPGGPPCGASISNHCATGVDIIRTISAGVALVGLLLDPDKNLGEGTRIPERYRGANR